MMKTKIYNLLTAGLLVFAGACSDDWDRPVASEGTLNLSSIGLQAGEVDDASRADDPYFDNYLVTIYDAQGVTNDDWTWTYSRMPEVVRLPTGNGYSIVVESHNIKPAAWEEPYFVGSVDFNIEQDKVTNLGTILCEFKSLKVTVKYTDELKSRMTADSKATIFKHESSDKLDYVRDETRAGYFEHNDASTTLVAMFNGVVDGNEMTETQLMNDVKPGTHVIVTFGVQPTPPIPLPTGTARPGVHIDVQFEEVSVNHTIGVEEGTLSGSDRPGGSQTTEPEQPENPDTPKAIEFTPEGVELNAPNKLVEGMTAIINISCPAGLAKLEVVIDSETLTPSELEGVGLVDRFDLCNPGDLKATLDNLLKVDSGTAMKGKTSEVFNVSDLVGLLELLGPGTSTFHLNVEDVNGAKDSTKLIIVAE